ncbi:MAG: peptidase, partial [Umezawaea sp.]
MTRRALPAALALAVSLFGITFTSTEAQASVCGDQVIANGGFESGTTPWTQTTGVISAGTTAQPAHSGTTDAWLGGDGTTHTDTLSQSVTLPAGCGSATLSYWLHVDTKETTTTVKYDKLTVQVGTATVAAYSNLDKNTGYAQKTVDLSAYLGQTVTL